MGLNRERLAGPTRVLGADPQKEKEILKKFEERFKKQPFFEAEREKTEEEKEVLSDILNFVPGFIKKYGCVPLPLVLDHFHLLSDYSKLTAPQYLYAERASGVYEMEDQLVILNTITPEKRALFLYEIAHVALHELLHFNSFQTLETSSGQEDFRRIGLSFRPRSGFDYLNYFVNEAVTEELAKRFIREYFPLIPRLKDTYLAYKKIADSFPNQFKEAVDDVFIFGFHSDETKVVLKGSRHSYSRSRDALNTVLTKASLDERFSGDKEKVFNIFANSYFSGGLLSLERVLRSNGSSLREMSKIKEKEEAGVI